MAQLVELARLFDGKISVLLDGNEVCILPERSECSMDDLVIAFNEVADNCVSYDPNAKFEW